MSRLLVTGASRLTTEVVDRWEDLEPLSDRWREWAVARGNAFLTPEWYLTALEHFPEAGEPAALVMRRGESVAGLLPMVSNGRDLRFGGAQTGDYFGLLCDEAESEGVVAAAAESLVSEPRARSVVLDNVSVGDAWWTGLSRGRAAVCYREDVLPCLDFEGRSWDEYLATRSSNLRSQVRRKGRKARRELGLEFRLADAGSLEDDMDAFFELHEQRWGERGGSHALTRQTRAFQLGFAQRALARGWLRLWIAEASGQAVAAWFGWRVGPRYSYYLAGLSPEHAQHSLGLVLLAHTMSEAASEGAATYDFLLGDEGYKARFATREEAVHTVVIVPRAHPLRAVATLDATMWRAGQRIPTQWRAPAHRVYRALAPLLPGGRRQ